MGGNTSKEFEPASSPSDTQPSVAASNMAEYVEAVVGKVADFGDNE